MTKRTFWIFLTSSAIVSGAISLWIGLRQSVWFDESYSIELAKSSVGQLLHLTATDVHPPFYYLLLKAWGSTFGWSELALRLMSVLFMMGALIVGGLLIRKMFGVRQAIGAVLLVMIAPLLLRYGFELRMYSLASLIGVSATFALYSAWKEKNRQHQIRWLIAYGLLVAIGMYTLYYLALLWAAHLVWLLYMKLRQKIAWRKFLPYILTYAGVAILFIPWLPTFLKQAGNNALGPAVQRLQLEQLLSIGTFNVFYQPIAMFSVILTMAFVVAVIAVIIAAIKARPTLKGRGDEVALLVMYLAVPIVIVMIISLVKPMYMERYLSHVAIGPLLLLGVVIVSAARKLKRTWQTSLLFVIVYGAVLIGCVHLSVIGNYSFQYYRTPPVRQVSASLSNCGGAYLLADGSYTASELMYYLPQCHIYFVDGAGTLGGGFSPLAGSPYQVRDVHTLTAPDITYVSYGTPNKDQLPSYTLQSTESYGAMSISTFTRQ
jgi:uncharacterized membrane protein